MRHIIASGMAAGVVLCGVQVATAGMPEIGTALAMVGVALAYITAACL